MTASVARGKALADTKMCVSCHGATYAGNGFYPNITPDPDNGIGDWTDGEIKAAITMGKKKDGTNLCPTMAQYPFTDTQVTDVVNFLDNLAPNTKKISQKCPG